MVNKMLHMSQEKKNLTGQLTLSPSKMVIVNIINHSFNYKAGNSFLPITFLFCSPEVIYTVRIGKKMFL